jgi:hypothetical protein
VGARGGKPHGLQSPHPLRAAKKKRPGGGQLSPRRAAVPLQEVIARFAEELVVAVAAGEPVVAGPALQVVGLAVADERVVAAVAYGHDPPVVGVVVEVVVPAVAVEVDPVDAPGVVRRGKHAVLDDLEHGAVQEYPRFRAGS